MRGWKRASRTRAVARAWMEAQPRGGGWMRDASADGWGVGWCVDLARGSWESSQPLDCLGLTTTTMNFLSSKDIYKYI